MSLQLVANHLAQKGRGPDSTLVHMSNREVAGLNALAQKHGGQLSVNPDTGLPEAGFLDSILPAVAGAGISYFSGGTIDPMMAAGIVGGITALDSKDLSKGLVAGLGAYGGAGMVGGLAGLGAAGADTAAMATPEYQAAVGTGAGNFASHPIDSLSTLGGGSALKGSLPILAGLAPAAAEAFDEEEGDGAPEQHKGYIRKYAFDPVTGQYKQVGVYEAGGDPNVDVSSKAGTAGAFGGVPEPEYQQPKGMADGGSTSDSSRIYDYLMGRGPNPMQFTHTTAPQVDYNVNKPITPTTPILDQQYDEYGNPISKAQKILQGGGHGEREPEDPNSFSAQWAAMNDAEKEAYRAENPKTAMAQDFVKYALIPGGMLLGGVQSLYKNIVGPDVSSPASTGMTGLPNSDPIAIANKYEQDKAANPMGKDPRQQKEAQERAVAESNAAANRAYGNAPEGRTGRDATAGDGNDRSQYGSVAPGYTGGSEAATGGLSTPYGFQSMAHGGIANLYNLGSYSDGGRLLKGPGDGVSDDIPATIGHGQPARLADGEFVIPARIVSEIGNGSTDAGARELYKMMDRIQAGRRKTVGKDQVAKNSKSVRHLPA